ncbi:hypothetical protein KEM56_004366 [Ascosphaera pollenicola]|nr:hypothetical protein KEM56_004366 [Ascosphaera pollenicola]
MANGPRILVRSVLPRLRKIGLTHNNFNIYTFIIYEDEEGHKAAQLLEQMVENNIPLAETAFRRSRKIFSFSNVKFASNGSKMNHDLWSMRDYDLYHYLTIQIHSHEHAVPLWKSIAAGRRFIVKVMTDPFDAEPLKRETRMYKYLGNTPSPLSPGFLAHVVSRNRVVGFALEKIENAHVILSSDDISCARDALESLHASGLMHGFAINSESYLVTGEGDEKKAYMISFGRTSFRNAVDDAKWGEFPQSDMDDLALLEESLKEIETESKKQDA